MCRWPEPVTVPARVSDAVLPEVRSVGLEVVVFVMIGAASVPDVPDAALRIPPNLFVEMELPTMEAKALPSTSTP